MASPEDMVELETVEETEVLRRLGTGEKAGLTTEEAARRLRVHGPNVVSRSRHEDSGFCEFLMMIFSIWGWHHASPNCKNMFCVMLNSMSWVAVLTTVVSLVIASVDQRSSILSLLDDPEQATAGIEVLECHSRIFVALKLMFLTTYIDSKGSKCCVFKGDPAKVAHQCGCSKAVKDKISMVMDNFALHGLSSHSCRTSGRLVLGVHCYSSDNILFSFLRKPVVDYKATRSNKEVHLSINGISDLFPEDNSDIVKMLRDLGCRYAMVGYEFLDHDAIAVQISREICQIMRGYTIFTVSSTAHLFGVPVILLLWNFDLPSLLALVIASFNYCTSFAILFERMKVSKLPDRWRVKKIIGSGVAFGSYIVLSTIIFFRAATLTNFLSYNFKSRSLMGGDEEIRAALFLQMSIVNQAVVLFAHSDDCCIIRCPGPFVAVTSIFTQMVATHKAVYGGLDFALAKGVGWVRAGLVWLCNFVVLMTPIFIYHRWRRANMTSEKLVTVCMHSAVLRLNLLWSLYVILDMRLQQPVPT
ncbi:hypothetical protein ACQ4PT_003455 [Festuca glaucescens]